MAANPWDIRTQEATTALAAGGARAKKRGQQASDFYMNEEMNFDPTKAYDEYMTGAASTMGKTLDTRLAALKGASVGAGRLNTGFLDEDTGKVAQNVASDFADTARSGAISTAGMRQSQLAGIGAYGANQDELGMETDASLADRYQAQANAEQERKQRKRSAIGATIGGALGGAGGFMIGGPAGAFAGAGAGSRIGGSF